MTPLCIAHKGTRRRCSMHEDAATPVRVTERRILMPEAHVRHEGHSHAHGPGCGHQAVKHDGHVDYLHNGHLHNVHGDSVHEHTIEVSPANPNRCTPKHQCSEHQGGHVHGPNCGHEAVP